MMTRPRFLKRPLSTLAALTLGAAGLGAVAIAGSPQANAAAGCSAAYSVQTDWGSGFTAQLTVTNNGTTAITGWTVTYSYTGNQTLSNGWSGTWTQSGKTVTVTNASYNGSLAVGAQATGVGANFAYSGTNTAPSSVTCTPAGGSTTGNTVTVTNPGSQTTTVGTAVSLAIKATADPDVLRHRHAGRAGDQHLHRADLRHAHHRGHVQRRGHGEGRHRRVRVGQLRLDHHGRHRQHRHRH
jgi:Cellulose binding domain